MELNKKYEEDSLIKGIREGVFYVVICEPLAECFANFTYCPRKDECEEIDEMSTDDLRHDRFCADCPEDFWLVVGVSIEKGKLGSGHLINATCAPEFGKYMKNLIMEFANP